MIMMRHNFDAIYASIANKLMIPIHWNNDEEEREKKWSSSYK